MTAQSENDRGWLPRIVQASVLAGFQRAYPRVHVNPDEYLRHVRRTYGFPIRSWEEVHQLREEIVNPAAERIILSSARMAALEGMGLGVGGLATVLPDMGILSAITLRMLQKLSLIYGFEYSTAEEVVALWVAVASAAGLDLTREFLEKQAADQIVPRIIDRMAVKVGAEAAEKWAGHLFPLLSAGAAATLNYYFVRSWGRRGQKHFLGRHRSLRGKRIIPAALLPEKTPIGQI